MRRLLPVLLLAACGDPSPLTRVEELRVLAIRLEPASPAPGEIPVLDALVADPTGDGFQTHTWWCVATPPDPALGPCGTGAIPEATSMVVFALACAPGACEGPGDDLSDPDAWMADLPIEGVSLARRTVPVSPSASARINENPVVSLVDAGVLDDVAVGSTVPLDVRVDDGASGEAAVLGFATAGGFRQPAAPVVDGLATIELLAPDEAGVFDLFLVADDGLGGAGWLVVRDVPVR